MNVTRWRLSVPLGLAVAAAIGLGTLGQGCGRNPLDSGPRRSLGGGTGGAPAHVGVGAGVAGALLRFAVIGDYGTDSENEARVARLVAGWNPQFVITAGDNNYPSGAAATIDQNIGKHYAAFIGGYTGKFGPGSGGANRFWPSLGNHDWVTADLRPYLDYFTLPGNERYYDVEAAPGLVHLFALDSDVHEPDGITAESAQALWLRGRLAASTACFRVVYFHHPPYSSSSVHGSSAHMRWPFEEWGADTVVAGHDHIYERLQVGGIPYFVVGIGGASLYAFSLFEVQPQSRVRFNSDYGAMLVSVDRQGMTFQFADTNGRVVDSYRYPKSCPLPSP